MSIGLVGGASVHMQALPSPRRPASPAEDTLYILIPSRPAVGTVVSCTSSPLHTSHTCCCRMLAAERSRAGRQMKNVARLWLCKVRQLLPQAASDAALVESARDNLGQQNGRMWGGGAGCNRLVVLMRGGVVIRGGLRRRDVMCAASAGEHLSALGAATPHGTWGTASPGHWQRGGQHTRGAICMPAQVSGCGEIAQADRACFG